MNPIAVVDQVLEEYRSYLATEFRASDEGLRQALENALDEPGFLAQEPFFQAHRPFKDGRRWRDLGLDAALAKAIERRSRSETSFLHQSDAITHLLSPSATPLVVTTGTGSGKTECFLLPVIQNAIEDSTRFKRSGITALLVYPMNALANDQDERIRGYLEVSGHTHVKVARYDRSTKQDERERMRREPPHILLTNYMMLEYLLVRPADRSALFANHRCRFVVLDEVHTYRGSLGANIALLYRRLVAHLRHATHDWNADDREDVRRFPRLVPVATSATIKSVDEAGRSHDEVIRLRDEAVQEFLGKLTGAEAKSFRVIGETLRDVAAPAEACWPSSPVAAEAPDYHDADAVRRTVAALAGLPAETSLEVAGRSAAILWKLGDLLARRPLSVSGIVDRVRAEVAERRDADPAAVRREVEAALVAGSSLPDGSPGALRLRAHRFVRGGWKFHRCVDPDCGRLFPMGEERCSCGMTTAPLFLCRACGADTLRLHSTDPKTHPLSLRGDPASEDEWLLYVRGRADDSDADDDLVGTEKEMKGRKVEHGSFDPATGLFDADPATYRVRVALAPGRNRCLACGAQAGGGSILTPVALGTSAAVRVLTEGLVEGLAVQHEGARGYDGKERILIFSDSRQDAAHQARFITYAGRYDRMRRRLVDLLREAGGSLTIEKAVQGLMVRGVKEHDNPNTVRYDDPQFLPQPVQAAARAWEEAPLLDDLAVSPAYRGTVFNLGLVGVRYEHLEAYVDKSGGALAGEFGITRSQLAHLSRCLLDEIRRRGALSRPLLSHHPQNPSCPDEVRVAADWERRVKSPRGYACTKSGDPLGSIDAAEIADGITAANAWRRAKGGRAPSLESKLRHLLKRFGGVDATEDLMVALLRFLSSGPRWIVPVALHGYRQSTTLLQVNAECVQLVLVDAADRFRCSICNVRLPWAGDGAACPTCHGTLRPWSDSEFRASRSVQRILRPHFLPLVAGEHTAQITGDQRIELEENFKGPASKSPINVLACSPTLEMGIDVGGLDGVVMRNIPPRPDNYAQRGGRAGRRSRVGIVLGYARSTPHDGYFYDKPEEMIAGEVPAPGIGFGSRDIVMRHLHAIAFGGAEPGLAGQMATYITLQGTQLDEAVEALVLSVSKQFDPAVELALEAWGPDVLEPAGLGTRDQLRAALDELPTRIRDLFARVRLQVAQLEQTIQQWAQLGKNDRAAVNAMELKRRLLGIRAQSNGASEADDRTSGHPMRRFAEFGILPGYEFPSEPATLRLLGDRNEDEPIAVERRFGIAQYQPEARAHARGHRWKVVGLDSASPWNSKSADPSWIYTICKPCNLHYGAQEHVSCPRCSSDETIGRGLAGYEFGGFLAMRDDTPVLEEEERFAISSLVQCHPQWNGVVTARYELPTAWTMELRVREEVRWVNEWKEPTDADRDDARRFLHEGGRGFYLCPDCGRTLKFTDEDSGKASKKGRAKPKTDKGPDVHGHAAGCPRLGQPPRPCALTAKTAATTLRIVVQLPTDFDEGEYQRWGYSLGYSLRTGMRQLYMLDGPEIDFELEPMWDAKDRDGRLKLGALTFVDPAVGGSGFLERAAREMHLVAARTIEHLDHPRCETACYRCLKSYNNQRHHQHLSWPRVLPDLEQLREMPPKPLALDKRDVGDPGPWLEAFDAGVGSPLELEFLKLFEANGLVVDKQVAIAADAGGPNISVADFVVRGSRVAIYVDGAAFHRGERLRRDRFIRERLRSGTAPWIVFEVRRPELTTAAELIRKLQAASATGDGARSKSG
ncbi:MAG: DEAD/DEAH box helicase [Planctomycetes bacterium]|nr:DEAD/DEAH box helicase [Planctomycetota bacterium]